MINEDDITIYDSSIGFENGKEFRLEITSTDVDELVSIRKEILDNQKIVNSVLELWLNMLNDGIGGMPTQEESVIFAKLNDILPKKLRDEKLEGLK